MKSRVYAYRYGTRRERGEGLRIGVTRYVPRGVRREEWQRLGYFDVRLPVLAPTKELLSLFLHGGIDVEIFSRRYLKQMQASESRQAIELLAAVSLSQPIGVGCFCEDESRCHRSLLCKLIEDEAKRR